MTPEQKMAIEDVISDVKAIRRKPNLARHEMHQYVRKIAEKLLRIFRR